jgi:hypothetical protein
MDHFAGLDVSVKKTSICIVDETGKIVREVKVVSEPQALLAVLANPAHHFKRIGLEAGPLLRTEPASAGSRLPGLGLREMLPRTHYEMLPRTHYNVWASVLNLDLKIFEPERASCAQAIRHSHPMRCINVRCYSRKRQTSA